MWGIFLIAFGVVVVAGALLLGWGVPFIALFGVVLVGAALFFAFQRTAVEPTTDGQLEAEPRKPSWLRKHWWE
jgi:hypothetical protein